MYATNKLAAEVNFGDVPSDTKNWKVMVEVACKDRKVLCAADMGKKCSRHVHRSTQ